MIPQTRTLLLCLCVLGGLGPGCKREEPGRLPVDRESRIRACTILRGCGHGVLDSVAVSIICGSETLSEAFALREHAEELIDCITAAPGEGEVCLGTARCLGFEGALCGGGGAVCAGDRIVSCSGGYVVAFDCSASGFTCVTDNSSNPACAIGMCMSNRCDGDDLYSCPSGVQSIQRCSVAGLTCRDDGPFPVCAGAGAPCDPATFQEGCDGTVARICWNGFEGALDCAQFLEGHTCTELPGGAVQCVPVMQGCADIADDECDGTVLRVCLDGQYWVYDCVDLGFSTCETIDDQELCVR